MLQKFKIESQLHEENNIDPDDGNSWMCMACKLPIFSTPFKETESSSSNINNLHLVHDECSDPPKDLQNPFWRESFSKQPLVLLPNQDQKCCGRCNDVCGNVLYHRSNEYDYFTLDLKCALTIKIMHRSHEHRLMAIRSWLDVSFPCGVCGTTHRPGMSWAQPVPLVYVCNVCCFWLHPHCASLPNVILLHGHSHGHPHPLLLNYTWIVCLIIKNGLYVRACAICGEDIKSRGAYTCTMCDFYVHIMCAVTDNQNFEYVLIRDARFPDLIHFPTPDEYTSVVRHITSSNINNLSSDVAVHQHPLTLNHHDIDEEDDRQRPSCNACVQVISPPFYTCSECLNLFLHDCCAYLSKMLKLQDFELSLVLDKPETNITHCCGLSTNGFVYRGTFNESIDVMCAIMPMSITHDAHSKTHILYSTFLISVILDNCRTCKCCGELLNDFYYYCGTCHNFKIHAKCARLPSTVGHVYDKHPLELVTAHAHTNTHHSLFCDACEEDLDHTHWYYRCHLCDQSFHVDCIPCLDNKSLIQFGKPILRLKCHKCPLALVRGEMVYGRRCGYCWQLIKNKDTSAYECTKCYYWIHESCAKINKS